MENSRNTRAKNWCFTVNNYSDDEYQRIKEMQVHTTYLIIGFEIGEEGTPHMQCFAQLKKRLRFSQVKELFGRRIHLERCKGSPAANYAYCSKYGNFEEYGTRTTSGMGLSARKGAYPLWFWIDI